MGNRPSKGRNQQAQLNWKNQRANKDCEFEPSDYELFREAWARAELEQNQDAIKKLEKCKEFCDKLRKDGVNEYLPPLDRDQAQQSQSIEISGSQNDHHIDQIQAPPSKLGQQPKKANEQFYNMYNYNNDGGMVFYDKFYQSPRQQLSAQLMPIQDGLNGLHYEDRHQRSSQLVLSPQYAINDDSYHENSDFVSNELLAVLLPILLISSCLFGMICMICLGFGGLFCYREGQKVGNDHEGDHNFYRKLSSKNGDNYKENCKVAHYDEIV